MNVILFSEGFGANYLIMNPHPILAGAFRIATHLRNTGHKVKVLSIWSAPFEEFKELVKPFLKKDVALIGISSTLIYYQPPLFDVHTTDLLNKIKFIKEEAPWAKLVMGGSMVGSVAFFHDPRLIKIHSLVDYFIQGQGETSIDALIDHIDNNQKIITTHVTPKIISDSVYKFENFSDAEIVYSKDDNLTKDDAMGIEFGRGCIFKCSFCGHQNIGKRPGTLSKSSKLIKNELVRNYEEHGIKYYYFTDDLLNESVEKLESLVEVANSLPFKLTYSAYIRLDLIHRFPVMAKLLLESGMVTGTAGIETINDSSGKSVYKGLGFKRINEALEICNSTWNGKVGIAGSFILGLPHDTTDTVYELLEWFDTRLVQETITDLNINALRLSKEMATNKSKYQYTQDMQRITGWTNQKGYSFEQAEKDSFMAYQHFYKKYKMPIPFGAFDIPQVFALAEKNNRLDEIKEFYFTREKIDGVTTLEDWHTLRLKWYIARRQEYINSIKEDSRL
jgi:radical SAM superfamily enzyme YgiQ (UPF0313 family)